MIYKYCNSGNDVAIFRVKDVLEHGPSPNIGVDIWHPAEMQKPTQALKSVKGLGNTFELNPKWARTLPSGIFHGIFKETSPPKKSFFLFEVDI